MWWMTPLFAVLYIAVDVIYVVSSKHTYFAVVEKIQKGTTDTTYMRIASAILAYTCMAIGWLYFVAPVVQANLAQKRLGIFLSGAVPGFLFGFVLYGVFNFTNYAMFQQWTPAILTRDMLWGTSWVTVLTIAYAYAQAHARRH
jgi:uncharacterized membrane protein